MLRSALLASALVGLILGGVPNAVAQPTSEGHPHKWRAVNESMADFVADGFQLKAVVYDTTQTPRGALPDVHYFLQKAAQLVRCDFRKRGESSIYWCYLLVNPRTP